MDEYKAKNGKMYFLIRKDGKTFAAITSERASSFEAGNDHIITNPKSPGGWYWIGERGGGLTQKSNQEGGPTTTTPDLAKIADILKDCDTNLRHLLSACGDVQESISKLMVEVAKCRAL